MNIQLIRLKGVVRELQRQNTFLERIAECFERDLSLRGVHMRPPHTDTSGEPPEVSYVDEEADYVVETFNAWKREHGKIIEE